MKRVMKYSAPIMSLLLLGACSTMPSGPDVMALPGTGKSFDLFRADDSQCRQFASAQVGGKTPGEVGSESGVKSAAVGTLIGAAAGGAINGGSGAAVGAGVGLAVGALAGTGAANTSSYGMQNRYDRAYIQCMYSKGHKVPVSGSYTSTNPAGPVINPAPRAAGAPPPPPGNPPPPPPR